MPNFKNKITLVIGATALFIGSANAHGWMTKPDTIMMVDGDKTKFSHVIDSSTLLWKGIFNQDPTTNTKNFWIALNSSEYKNIRELITKVAKIDTPGATIECGITDPDAPPQPLPDMVEWSHSASEGFTQSHEGGCEVWCDDKLAFQDENCAKHYPKAPALLPYNKAVCEGASRLTFYWMALHGPTWQCYINCAPLEGGTGGTTPNVTTPTTTPSTYVPATPAPPAPPSSYAPEPPTDAPTTTPPSTPPADDQAPSPSPYAPGTPSSAPPAPPTTPPADAPAIPNAKCVRHRRIRD